MVKVKMVDTFYASELENLINEFCTSHRIIDIKYQMSYDVVAFHSALIIYDDENNKLID